MVIHLIPTKNENKNSYFFFFLFFCLVIALFLGALTATKASSGHTAHRGSYHLATPTPFADSVKKKTDSFNVSDDPLLILVNKKNKLPKNYSITLKKLKNGKQVAKIMYRDLRNMWFDCEASHPGYSITVVSGYRTSAKQQTLLRYEIIKNESVGMNDKLAKKDALRSVAPAYYSEHETGLCVDIAASDYLQLNRKQENTPENQWLRRHCAKYGFILRYPKKKEKITGYMYEPWHFRYVGKKAAQAITNQHLSLEEYLGICKTK